MKEKKNLAQFLFMTQGKTQREIAAEVGISERTLYTWIHQCAWDKLKLAAFQAPATIAENLCSQLVELQNAIAKREPGNRFPTADEAEITRKLITCIDKMKKYPSVSQNMQTLETFKNFIRPINKEFAAQLGNYTERFLSGKTVNGFAPYQLEYGVEQVAPLMPFYDEPEIPEDKPCTDLNTCLHPGDCNWPHCRHSKQWYDSVSPDPLKQNSVTPIPAISEQERLLAYNKYMAEKGFPAKQSETQ